MNIPKRIRTFFTSPLYRITNAWFAAHTKGLLNKNFTHCTILGLGKDGTTYHCTTRSGQSYIVKALSAFGRQYLPMTKEYNRERVDSPALYPLTIIDDWLVCSPYEELHDASSNPKQFLSTLQQLCAMEGALLRHNLCYWDFGFIDHCNYMVNERGDIRIVDYGGNAFLRTDIRSGITIPHARRNLVYAKNDFVQLQFLYHLYYFGLGRRTREMRATLAQDWDDAELVRQKHACLKELKGTLFEKISLAITQNNLLSPTGWEHVKQAIVNVIAHEDVEHAVQESADIDFVTSTGNAVEVRGYQTFRLTAQSIEPLARHNKTLWDTEAKFHSVDTALHDILARDRIESFLDIGSNLGLYVFLAHIRYDIPQCIGVDYNQTYISTCITIVQRLGLSGCTFQQKSFDEVTDQYDCVLAMGLIHHLFHRTEGYGSLQLIMERFAAITKKFAIIEFPTEHDPKARKWTNIPGRAIKERYSLERFLEVSQQIFPEIQKIAEVNATRPVYLLRAAEGGQ